MTTLRELLQTPFILSISSQCDDDGVWARKAEFEELADCWTIDPDPWDAVERLYRQLPRYLIDRVRRGDPPPVVRRNLLSINVESQLVELQLGDWAQYLDSDISALASAEGSTEPSSAEGLPRS
jgi:hypothetical protein